MPRVWLPPPPPAAVSSGEPDAPVPVVSTIRSHPSATAKQALKDAAPGRSIVSFRPHSLSLPSTPARIPSCRQAAGRTPLTGRKASRPPSAVDICFPFVYSAAVIHGRRRLADERERVVDPARARAEHATARKIKGVIRQRGFSKPAARDGTRSRICALMER